MTFRLTLSLFSMTFVLSFCIAILRSSFSDLSHEHTALFAMITYFRAIFILRLGKCWLLKFTLAIKKRFDTLIGEKVPFRSWVLKHPNPMEAQRKLTSPTIKRLNIIPVLFSYYSKSFARTTTSTSFGAFFESFSCAKCLRRASNTFRLCPRFSLSWAQRLAWLCAASFKSFQRKKRKKSCAIGFVQFCFPLHGSWAVLQQIRSLTST
jgi:hypothetical protein